jgi:hypothetical protein
MGAAVALKKVDTFRSTKMLRKSIEVSKRSEVPDFAAERMRQERWDLDAGNATGLLGLAARSKHPHRFADASAPP